MRFEDERYIRVYTRDTTTMVMLSWEARALMYEVFRKVDRAGLLDLGADGLDALAATVRMPLDVVGRAVPELIRRKVIELRPDGLLICPRFVEAQEALLSDKARARASRERARDLARAVDEGVTPCDTPSRHVTDGHEANENVTSSHTPSRAVTRGHSEPSEPSTPSTPSERERPSAPSPQAAPPTPPVTVTGGIAGNAVNGNLGQPAIPCLSQESTKPSRKPHATGHRIPTGWAPSEATVEYCHGLGVDPIPVVASFADYWEGVPGSRGVKVTWDGTFRNWVRRLVADGKAPAWRPPKLDEFGQPQRYTECGLPIFRSPDRDDFIPDNEEEARNLILYGRKKVANV